VANLFINDPAQRILTPRESRANLFTTDPDLFKLTQPRQDSFCFTMEAAPAVRATPLDLSASVAVGAAPVGMTAAPAEAYNPGRDMGVLLQDHIQELSRLEQQLPPEQQTSVDVSTLKTEQDASNYIGQVVPQLRAQGAKGEQP
jgi:hypothetical protein